MSEVANDQNWFSVRCIYLHDDEPPATYEERITLWRAASFAEAIALAEAEGQDYAEMIGSTYLGLAQAYRLADEVGQGAEVYSLMRDSYLSPDEYMTAFFDTGSERQGSAESSLVEKERRGEPSVRRPP